MGDPFSRCYTITGNNLNIFIKLFNFIKKYSISICWISLFSAPVVVPSVERDPCVPSPCGPNSVCRNLNGIPSCSCQPNYEGSPPNCRPECTINEDCSSNLACINQKCKDPCPGSCGINANCQVIQHLAICTCIEGFTGNAFTQCTPTPEIGTLFLENNIVIVFSTDYDWFMYEMFIF